MRPQLLGGCQARRHGDGAYVVRLGRQDVGGRVANQRHGRPARNPAPAPRFPNRDLRQARPGLRHLAEGAESKIPAQARALQLVPADARQVARHQAEQDTPPRQPLQHRHHARTMLAAQVGAPAQVVALGGALDFGHGLANGGAPCAGLAHHGRQNVRVQHSL